MNDISKNFIDNLRVTSESPRLSNDEFNNLKKAYDANKLAAMEAMGTTLAEFGIGVPVGLLTNLFDSLMAVPKLFIDPQGLSDEARNSKYGEGPLTRKLMEGLTEDGPLAEGARRASKTMGNTSGDAREYAAERQRRVNQKTLETAKMLDPMNFFRNLRNNTNK